MRDLIDYSFAPVLLRCPGESAILYPLFLPLLPFQVTASALLTHALTVMVAAPRGVFSAFSHKVRLPQQFLLSFFSLFPLHTQVGQGWMQGAHSKNFATTSPTMAKKKNGFGFRRPVFSPFLFFLLRQ